MKLKELIKLFVEKMRQHDIDGALDILDEHFILEWDWVWEEHKDSKYLKKIRTRYTRNNLGVL